MMPGEDTVTASGNRSFEAMLDEVCDKLWDRRVGYSLRRIREMDAALSALERELDELVLRGEARPGRSGKGTSQDLRG
jgi:hypothetical protein